MSDVQYLLDSNFVVALMDGNDVHHPRARELFDRIQGEEAQIFLSDLLLNETLSVFAKRCEAQKREKDFPPLVRKFQSAIRGLPLLCLYELFNEKFDQIVEMMMRFQGRFNFHDALILFFLREVSDVVLVTFDADFKTLSGIKTLPA